MATKNELRAQKLDERINKLENEYGQGADIGRRQMIAELKAERATLRPTKLTPPISAALKWYPFTPGVAANRQKLPEPKKWVLVMLDGNSAVNPNPIVVGYLKYAAGCRNEPYFVTPGASVPKYTPDRVLAWCDGLLPGFEWPEIPA